MIYINLFNSSNDLEPYVKFDQGIDPYEIAFFIQNLTPDSVFKQLIEKKLVTHPDIKAEVIRHLAAFNHNKKQDALKPIISKGHV